VLIDKVFAAHGASWKLPSKTADLRLYQKMRDQAERARRKLSSESAATMSVTWKDQSYDVPVTDDEFAGAAGTLLDRLRNPVLRALRDSNIPVASLAEIVLVGGATRMPIVRKAVTKMFGRFPAAQVNPDEAVAIGAAVQAGLKSRDADLKEIVLTDVCPYTLGIDIGERMPNGQVRTGIFAPIIERNTIVPASRERSFSPLEDTQRVVEFGVFQGESPLVADNIRLGKISVPIPPSGRAREVVVICRFTYDINGLLEVELHVPSTGERRELVIMENDTTMSAADLEKRREFLAKLKVHPREQEANRAAIARGVRCYEDSLGQRRELVNQCMSRFVAVVEDQDPRAIETAREQFLKELDALEGETFL
jgi:molecular chaperone HscC